MLLGVRPDRADELVAAGHRLRVYVPYGDRLVPVLGAAATGESEAGGLRRRRPLPPLSPVGLSAAADEE